MNAKDLAKSTQVFHQEYEDAEGNTHTEYKDVQENIHSDYEYKDAQGNLHFDENGYIDSQLAAEEEDIQDIQESRADKNVSKEILIGVIVTCVAGLSVGAIYFLTQQNNERPIYWMNGQMGEMYERNQVPNPPSEQVKEPMEQASQAPSPAPKSATNSNLSKRDSDLKKEILTKLNNNLPNHQLMVEVKNGEVTVSGTVATPEQLQQIQSLLKSVEEIGKVDITATVASKDTAK